MSLSRVHRYNEFEIYKKRQRRTHLHLAQEHTQRHSSARTGNS